MNKHITYLLPSLNVVRRGCRVVGKTKGVQGHKLLKLNPFVLCLQWVNTYNCKIYYINP